MSATTRLLLGLVLLWSLPIASALAETAEDTLINYYYQSILGRTAEPEGAAHWANELSRLKGLEQESGEVLIAMSNHFFNSVEYGSRNRTDTQVVLDLYRTFLQRDPDPAEFEYWADSVAQGIPLSVILASFQFSTEFEEFVRAHLGPIGARTEGSLVLDFYRGYLDRLPEPGGLEYWISHFGADQCTNSDAFAAQVATIAEQFQNSTEYVSRNRSNHQFVGDLYSTFMRSSAETDGLAYFSQQLDGGASRASVQQAFLNSDEFEKRLAAAFREVCF